MIVYSYCIEISARGCSAPGGNERSIMVKVEDQEGKPVWDRPVAVDEKWIQFVDECVSESKPIAAWFNWRLK